MSVVWFREFVCLRADQNFDIPTGAARQAGVGGDGGGEGVTRGDRASSGGGLSNP